MLEDERVSSEFYRAKTAEWDGQRESGGGGNFHATQNAYLSEKFAREVFARYARGQISLNEAADYFDVACEFRRNPATDSDLMPAAVPI